MILRWTLAPAEAGVGALRSQTDAVVPVIQSVLSRLWACLAEFVSPVLLPQHLAPSCWGSEPSSLDGKHWISETSYGLLCFLRESLTEEAPVLLVLLLPRPELLHHAEEQLHGLPVGTLIQINEERALGWIRGFLKLLVFEELQSTNLLCFVFSLWCWRGFCDLVG